LARCRTEKLMANLLNAKDAEEIKTSRENAGKYH
jgi:hypothetical protein